MHDELRRRTPHFPSFWTVQIVGWCCFYLSAVVTAVPELKSGGLWTASAFVVTTFAASCLMRPICIALMRRSQSWVALEVQAFAFCVPAGIVTAFVVGVLTERRVPGWIDWLETSVQASFVLFVWCSLYFSLKLWQQSVREHERRLQAESEVRDARLSALRYQLNPHFLFNSLNAASTLVLEGDTPAATRMLAQIADFMRTILDGDARPETRLSRELAYTEQYLAIEQTRLRNRLRVETSIAPQSLDAIVPTMLLQPLVENAVRHGIAPLVEGGTIRISSATHGQTLRISVWNSGMARAAVRPQRDSAAIGLSNTTARLTTLYGADYRFASQATTPDGWEAAVELPLRFAASGSEERACVP